VIGDSPGATRANQSPSAPTGWYPDPSGERQWRRWDGEWTSRVHPYDHAANSVADLSLLRALRAQYLYGAASFFAGAGLVLGMVHHWPGTKHPVSLDVATTLTTIGGALLVLGYAHYVRLALALDRRHSLSCWLPIENVLLVTTLLLHRLDNQRVRRTVLAEALLMALLVFAGGPFAWLFVIAPLLALQHVTLTRVVFDHLT